MTTRSQPPKSEGEYSEKETKRRMKAALQGAFSTPPKPLKSIKKNTQTVKSKKRKTET